MERTLNDLEDDGYTHIVIQCETCRMLVSKPIKTFPEIWLRRPFDRIVEHLVCERCGSKPKPENVRPWRVTDASGRPW